MPSQPPEILSDQLEDWLKSKQPKTLASLIELFQDKSFAVIIMLCMFLPALPLPTGGVTHVLEVVTVLLAAEQVVGLRRLWLPPFLSKRLKLGALLQGKLGAVLLRRLRWLEKHSSPRGRWLFRLPLLSRGLALIVIGLTVTAFVSPPFSGLDTPPSLGVVMISLAELLEDAWLLLAAGLVGALGVFLSVGLGAAIVQAAHRLL